MGQNNSMELPQSSSQRIRPTPGSQGRRNRKGTISVYCENSHSIYTFMSKPGMTIGDLKNLLPNKNCDLKILKLLDYFYLIQSHLFLQFYDFCLSLGDLNLKIYNFDNI